MLTNTLIAEYIILDLYFASDLDKSQFVSIEDEVFFFGGTQKIQISDNNDRYNFHPMITNGQAGWLADDDYSYPGEDNSALFFYDGSKTIQLADNTVQNTDVSSFDILDGKIVWSQSQDIPNTQLRQSRVFLYDGTKTIQITDDRVNARSALFYGSQIVWEEKAPEEGEDYEIILYNNGQTQRLTDNQIDENLEKVQGNYILWTTSFNPTTTSADNLYVYDGNKVVQLTTNNLKPNDYGYALVEGNYIFWTGFDPNTSLENLFVYDGNKIVQLTVNGYDSKNFHNTNNFDIDSQNVVWKENNNIYLYDGNTTKQITNDGTNKSGVQVSGNKIVWFGSNSNNQYEVFLYDGSITTQLTDNNFYKSNLLIDGENIVWQANISDDPSNPNYNIYIYRNGAVSAIVETEENEKVISLEGNKLLWAIDPFNSYYRSVDRLFLATWTDDTFPILSNPDQYGASHPDLIEFYGYDLEGFNQHYRQFGIAEGRSLDTFDEYRYIASNPIDLIEFYGTDGKAATQHYIRKGYKENRKLDTFQAEQYVASYKDLINAFGGSYSYNSNIPLELTEATIHYIRDGYKEDRTTDTFDEISYLAANPDLLEAFDTDLKEATKHYIQEGHYLRPLTFDASLYLASNTDLINKLSTNRSVATSHYVYSGYDEKRSTNSFDPLQYIASYETLIVNFGQNGINLAGATNHFVDAGYQQGFIKDTFNEYRYIASNDDLIVEYGGDYYSFDAVDGYGATVHYIVDGFANDRPTTTFDPFAYMAVNSDVADAYQSDATLATLHYITFGYYEKRQTALSVDPLVANLAGDDMIIGG